MSGSDIRWSEAALALFRLDRPTAVSAGAGSGKTTCLVELCARLLSGDATGTALEPAEIVAITFTDKAAQELEERLREAIAARARAAAPASEEARAWRSRLHALDAMAVGTIHGFAMRLLREHALAAGIDPEHEVLDEETASEWRLEAARAAVVAAADRRDPGALALAAAHGASGRRGGLSGVVADLLRERSSRGLAGAPLPAPAPVAEAEAARAALLHAARALVAARGEVRTASGVAALERLAAAVAVVPRADREGPLSAAGVARLAALAEATKGWRLGKSDEPLRPLRDALAEEAERFPPLAAGVLAAPQVAALCALAADAAARYATRKAREASLDFDDLLLGARDLLRDHPAIRARLRARVRALLVDEYQDVNGLQQELVDLLAGEGGPTLVAVGDLKQSIYRFRGADVAVFRGVVERFAAEGADGRVLHLSENHRSVPGVLALVNEVSVRAMQPGPAQGGASRPYELAFGDADRLVARREGAGGPACELLVDGEGGTADERRAREAEAIARRIRALVSGEAGVRLRAKDGSERTPRPGDVAILFRRLTTLAPYERALREAGLPFRLARGGGFYQAPEVRDLGELLASLVEPEDPVAWAALLRSPLCGVSDAALFLLARDGLTRLARHDPVAPLAPADAARLGRFLREWRALHAVRDRIPPAELLERAAERLGLVDAHLAGAGGPRAAANVRKALALAARFSDAGGTAGELARRIRALAARPPREPEAELDAADAVAVLSVHQSKGLEWPVVFVPDLGAAARRDGRRALLDAEGRACAAFWDAGREAFLESATVRAARAEEARAAAAESRRLLYVALTRARDRLVLSGESARGAADGWRAMVEAALAARPELAVRVDVAAMATAPAGPAEAAPPPALEPALPLEPAHARGPGVLPPPVPRVPVTLLAEQARCARRPWLARQGIVERASTRGSAQDDPGRATARGTLAHACLSEIDLGAPPLQRRAQLAAVATRRGFDPTAKGVRRILDDVARFLDAPAGRALAAEARRGRLSREVPFLVRLEAEGKACYVSGAIDALVDRGGELVVVDYKYALASPGALQRYRDQLLAYCVATARARPGLRVRARLQFLRGACAAVELAPSVAELEAFARAAPLLAAAATGSAPPPEPAALARDAEQCRGDGCGHLATCYARAG